MYFNLLNWICIIYLIWLFFNKYAVSLSVYWVVVFYAIYVFVPFVYKLSPTSVYIPEFVIEEISFYSLVGIISFIFGNAIFTIFMKKKPILLTPKKEIIIPFSSIKKLFLLLISIWIILTIMTLGFDGVVSLFVEGSRDFIVLNHSGNSLLTLWHLLLFYLAMTAIALVIAASTSNEKKFAVRVFIIIIIFVGIIFSFARRYILYPVMALCFYKLLKLQSRVKVIFYGVLGIIMFVVAMYVMGVVRVYGIDQIFLAREVLLTTNSPLEVLLDSVDFTASYKFLAAQVLMGDVTANPLGYLKVLFMWIPRGIFPYKPNYSSIEIFSQIDPVASANGVTAATGYIGEALATMGILGIIIISYLWGLLCGFLDVKYLNRVFNYKGLRITDFQYLFVGAQFITEAHRGDFGVASIHFVLEVVSLCVVMILLKYIKLSNKLDGKGVKVEHYATTYFKKL
jgi:hypothetical protein